MYIHICAYMAFIWIYNSVHEYEYTQLIHVNICSIISLLICTIIRIFTIIPFACYHSLGPWQWHFTSMHKTRYAMTMTLINTYMKRGRSHHRSGFTDLNSLWPRDTIWHQKYWSTLVQVLARCRQENLKIPSRKTRLEIPFFSNRIEIS